MPSDKNAKKNTAAKKAETPYAKKGGKDNNNNAKQAAPAKKEQKKERNPLFEARPKNFTIGNDIRPTQDLTRFVRWPKYVRVQRKKRILQLRMKVPPTVNQFSKTLNKNLATSLFKLLNKYRPEDKVAKRDRLKKIAEAKAKNEKLDLPRPLTVATGLRKVTTLIERKKAGLVVIAHDVEPMELVVWLPTLCRKLDVPYCIVKGRARLGQVVHMKNAAVVALTDVRNEDKEELSKLTTAIRAGYNDKYDELRKLWGGGLLGPKALAARAKAARRVKHEAAKLNKGKKEETQ